MMRFKHGKLSSFISVYASWGAVSSCLELHWFSIGPENTGLAKLS